MNAEIGEICYIPCNDPKSECGVVGGRFYILPMVVCGVDHRGIQLTDLWNISLPCILPGHVPVSNNMQDAIQSLLFMIESEMGRVSELFEDDQSESLGAYLEKLGDWHGEAYLRSARTSDRNDWVEVDSLKKSLRAR